MSTVYPEAVAGITVLEHRLQATILSAQGVQVTELYCCLLTAVAVVAYVYYAPFPLELRCRWICAEHCKAEAPMIVKQCSVS